MTGKTIVGRRAVVVGLAVTGVAAGAAGLIVATDGAGRRIGRNARDGLRQAVQGKVFWRGDEAYETSRRAAVYKSNKPQRYPELIVLPETAEDVVQAIRFANTHDLKVGVRSGGHSWAAAHVRDKAMMIDMSHMQAVEVDEATKTLWTNPGVIGSRVNALLEPYDLMVPTAHHLSPGIGGFCMNGGFGWNSRHWGNGAHHVLAIDVVTADGRLIRADAKQNSDYWWAARGGGAGFFGVIVRMQLQAHVRPKVWKMSAYGFDDAASVYDELMTWACDILPTLPSYLELMISSTAHDRKSGAPVPARITMGALVITDSEDEADSALDILRTCPVLDKAAFKIEKAPTTLQDAYMGGTRADPAGYRCATDNFYTDSPTERVVPRMRQLFLELPTPRTHVLWFGWGAARPFPQDMALSMQAPIYVACYTLWDDRSRDAELEAWAPDKVRALADISIGGQMNDENMLHHPQRYFTSEAYEKLERLRREHDPYRRFVSFLGDPFPA